VVERLLGDGELRQVERVVAAHSPGRRFRPSMKASFFACARSARRVNG